MIKSFEVRFLSKYSSHLPGNFRHLNLKIVKIVQCRGVSVIQKEKYNVSTNVMNYVYLLIIPFYRHPTPPPSYMIL